MGENKQKKADSILVGSIVWTVLFFCIVIYNLIFKKNFDWVAFLIGGASLIVLVYTLKKTKVNLNERYDDERKKYISEKSSSISYDVLFTVVLIEYFLIKSGKVILNSNDAILIIIGSALIIKFIAYLICTYKY